MGSGFGEGENRAEEAAQEAISSPLLDNVSIQGAKGVLINITGGMDLGIDEVTQISTIIQEAAGDEAEIIFGAVHDPEMQKQVRVTVIATGFDADIEQGVIRPEFRRAPAPPNRQPEVRSQPQVQRQVAMGGGAPTPIGGARSVPGAPPVSRMPAPPTGPAPLPMTSAEDVRELDIPTFIRRRYD